jgi:hypothetical protein
MSTFYVRFQENGEEYIGALTVSCEDIALDDMNNCVFYADGVRIEIDEPIIEIIDANGQEVKETVQPL